LAGILALELEFLAITEPELLRAIYGNFYCASACGMFGLQVSALAA
jgi:hypothetical protein